VQISLCAAADLPFRQAAGASALKRTRAAAFARVAPRGQRAQSRAGQPTIPKAILVRRNS